jgi:hypothetical protein
MTKMIVLLALIAAVAAVPAADAYVTIDGLISVNHSFATYLRGAENHGDWLGVGYQYSMPSAIGFAAGNQLNDSAAGAPRDGSWIQEFSGGGGVWTGQGTIFDLGFASSVVDVFPFIDHATPPETELQEGTEFRVYGSNNLTDWYAADWTTTWTQGYRADAIYDNYTSRWQWGSGYRFVGIVSGNSETNFLSDDSEIDAVGAPVPEPASLLLLGGGALGMVGAYLPSRRKARRG